MTSDQEDTCYPTTECLLRERGSEAVGMHFVDQSHTDTLLPRLGERSGCTRPSLLKLYLYPNCCPFSACLGKSFFHIKSMKPFRNLRPAEPSNSHLHTGADNSQSQKRSQYSREEWERQKELIFKYYVEEKLSLKKTIAKFAAANFIAK